MASNEEMAKRERKLLEDTLWLREEFFRRVPVLTVEELRKTPAAIAEGGEVGIRRWRKEKTIFAVRHRGKDLYPVFQFASDGRPLKIIATLLETFSREPGRTDWDSALWFAAPNGWLNGSPPIEMLSEDPDLVIDAATQEVLPQIE